MQRLRRFVPGLVGLGLAVMILWRGGAVLEHQAESHESFAVVVDQPSRVIPLATAGATSPALLTWRGRVQPASERERVTLQVDGSAAVASDRAEGGQLELPLADLSRAPGWHFVEVGLNRRGGRRERVVDSVLVGRFAAPNSNTKPCGATFSASPQLVRSLVIPMLEREVLPALRANEHMGPDTELSTAKLDLRDDVVHFELEVTGVNTLAVSGVVVVAIVEERELYAKLVTLGDVDFRGALRNKARGIGAGGGALIGGLIGGPLAPVGAAAGWYLADKVVTKKARELVRQQIDDGLAQLSGTELLPTHVELVQGQPSSRVALGFCEQTGVRATGLFAGLWIVPAPEAGPPRFDLGVPGPLITGATPTAEPLGAGEDLRVELSIDLVNALVTQWTANGLLAELIGEQRVLAHANHELESWTPLRLGGLRPTRPPTLTPVGGPDAGWAYGLGGLQITLTGVDDQPWGQVFVGAAGTLSPSWDPDAGELSLIGSLDRLDITCALPDKSGAGRALRGCFSEVLEAAEVRDRIDAHLRPGARNLPKLALRELLADELGVQLGDLSMSRPRPGLLRVAATLRDATP
ncbi:hypothetical protein DB30_07866 [Enhygromyxa salina]|uniref:Uncharacterized protein n=1 Tax=Enhygromyxa salina TaxID=215803 RepID=A0A0C1ZRM6_9BACT|nr:hypothetical protein [Enhygromyxa salina]KIG13658.1 hypothetical protein DB30_07866 [Enhygromyxa salina]